MVGVPFIQESGCEMCSWDQHRIETTGVCSELVQCTSPKHPQTSPNIPKHPQTSPNIPKPPKLRPYENYWKLMTGVATEQRDPNTTRYDTALLSLWGALVVVDRCRRCDRGLWSRCAEAAAAGDWQPRAGQIWPDATRITIAAIAKDC